MATPKIKFTVEFTEEQAGDFEKLCDKVGTTKIEVVRRALNLFELAVGMNDNGDKLQVRHADGSIDGVILV